MNFEKIKTALKRNPVVIIGFITALLQYLAAALLNNWDSVSSILADRGVAAFWVAIFFTILSSFVARRFVTPNNSPRDNDGNQLGAILTRED